MSATVLYMLILSIVGRCAEPPKKAPFGLDRAQVTLEQYGRMEKILLDGKDHVTRLQSEILKLGREAKKSEANQDFKMAFKTTSEEWKSAQKATFTDCVKVIDEERLKTWRSSVYVSMKLPKDWDKLKLTTQQKMDMVPDYSFNKSRLNDSEQSLAVVEKKYNTLADRIANLMMKSPVTNDKVADLQVEMDKLMDTGIDNIILSEVIKGQFDTAMRYYLTNDQKDQLDILEVRSLLLPPYTFLKLTDDQIRQAKPIIAKLMPPIRICTERLAELDQKQLNNLQRSQLYHTIGNHDMFGKLEGTGGIAADTIKTKIRTGEMTRTKIEKFVRPLITEFNLEMDKILSEEQKIIIKGKK